MQKAPHQKSARSGSQKLAETAPGQREITSAMEASELFFSWWPSSSFPMPWWPELQETFADLFKRAHRILTTNGFLVIADPYNESGGKIWRLTSKPTSQLPKCVVPVDFARQCLESQDVRVQAVEQKGGVFHIYLYPPATMEDRLGEAWKRAKESIVPTEITSSTRHDDQDPPKTLQFRHREDVIEPQWPVEVNKQSAVAHTYDVLIVDMALARSIVRSYGGRITVDDLKPKFRNRLLSDAQDEKDWQLLIDEFSQRRSTGDRNLTIGLLGKRTGLSNATVDTYTKRSRRQRNGR